MILVAGATGFLGFTIVRTLREQGQEVRALVRATAKPTAVDNLRSLGAQIVVGDLKDSATLASACQGVDAVISGASAMVSHGPADTLSAVDRDGHLSLIDECGRHGVKRFVFVSFPFRDREYPLQAAKRAVEDRLTKSGLSYTILKPTFFYEIWLSPMLLPNFGINMERKSALFVGSGEKAISWISVEDVGKVAAFASTSSKWAEKTIHLGGPTAVTPRQFVGELGERLGCVFQVDTVPEAALVGLYESTEDPFQKSFAGLMLSLASGDEVQAQPLVKELPWTFRSVSSHLANLSSPSTSP